MQATMQATKNGIKSLYTGTYSVDNWTAKGYAQDADTDYTYLFNITKDNRNITLQVIWIGTVGGSGTATLQVSANGVDFTTVKDTAGTDVVSTITGSADHDTITLIGAAVGYYRIVYDHGTNDDGSIIVNIFEG